MLPRAVLQRGRGIAYPSTTKLRPLVPASSPPSSLPPAAGRRRPFSSSASTTTRSNTAASKNAATDIWTTKDKAGLLLFGGLVVGTGSLGVWQAQRYYWKIDAIKERSEKLVKQPEPLTK